MSGSCTALGAAPELHPALVRIVDQEKEGPVVLGQVACRHILPVAREIREAERLFIEDTNEAGGSAAMLSVGLPVRTGRGEEGRVDLGEESDEVRCDQRPETATGLHALIGAPRAALRLDGLDPGREGDVAR